MKNNIIPVGYYAKEFDKYLGQSFNNKIIYRSAGLEKHILKRHPECLQYIELIPQILFSPDYIGINPNESLPSFELIKTFHKNIQLGIKLDVKDNYLYVATLHTITESKLRHNLKSGRIQKFDK